MPTPPLPHDAPITSANDAPPHKLDRERLDAQLIYLRSALTEEANHYSAQIVTDAMETINQLERDRAFSEELIANQKRELGDMHLRLKRLRRVTLPGEPARHPAPLPWEENPAPDSRSALEVVISQPKAIRALVRHFGWVHHGANILFRPDKPGGHVVTSPATTPVDGSVIDLVEAPGSIADLAAAAAASVA